MLKNLISGEELRSTRANVGLLALRVFAGLGLAFGHGLGKIPPSPRFIEGVSNMGFPLPSFFAWSAGISEFVGGIFLALGLFTRPSSFFIGLTIATAAFIRHADDPFGGKEKALLYLFVIILFFVTGAGKYSVDNKLRRR